MSTTTGTRTSTKDRPRAKKTLAGFIDGVRALHPQAASASLREIALTDLRKRLVVDDGWEPVVFELMAAGLKLHVFDKRPRAPTLTTRELAGQRLRVKDEMKRRLAGHIEEQVAIRLLEHVTLLGTPLGECTGADCKKLSIRDRDFYGEIAKRLRPSERVRNHLSEDELQSIHRRCRLAA